MQKYDMDLKAVYSQCFKTQNIFLTTNNDFFNLLVYFAFS